jgi:uncharacterized small protein (DUF1192 family)
MATDANHAEATMTGSSTTPPSTPASGKNAATSMEITTDQRYKDFMEPFATKPERVDCPSTPSWSLQRRPTPPWDPSMSIFKSPMDERMSMRVAWGEDGLPRGRNAEMLLHPGFLEWQRAQPEPWKFALANAQADIRRLAHPRRTLPQPTVEVQGSKVAESRGGHYSSGSRPGADVFWLPLSSPAYDAEEGHAVTPTTSIAELEAAIQRVREEGERLEAELRKRRIAEGVDEDEKRT